MNKSRSQRNAGSGFGIVASGQGTPLSAQPTSPLLGETFLFPLKGGMSALLTRGLPRRGSNVAPRHHNYSFFFILSSLFFFYPSSKFVILFILIPSVERLCSSAEVVGGSTPATPRRISSMLNEIINR